MFALQKKQIPYKTLRETRKEVKQSKSFLKILYR